MSVIERFMVVAFMLTVPGSFHLWLGHTAGSSFLEMWESESLFWIIYDIYTLIIASLTLVAIVMLVLANIFQQRWQHYLYRRELNKILRRQELELHIAYRAKQVGFDVESLKDSNAVAFKVTASADDVQQFEQEIIDYMATLTARKIKLEDIGQRFRRKLIFLD